MKNFFDFYTRL